jgi:hypothetical protein
VVDSGKFKSNFSEKQTTSLGENPLDYQHKTLGRTSMHSSGSRSQPRAERRQVNSKKFVLSEWQLNFHERLSAMTTARVLPMPGGAGRPYPPTSGTNEKN